MTGTPRPFNGRTSPPFRMEPSLHGCDTPVPVSQRQADLPATLEVGTEQIRTVPKDLLGHYKAVKPHKGARQPLKEIKN